MEFGDETLSFGFKKEVRKDLKLLRSQKSYRRDTDYGFCAKMSCLIRSEEVPTYNELRILKFINKTVFYSELMCKTVYFVPKKDLSLGKI